MLTLVTKIPLHSSPDGGSALIALSCSHALSLRPFILRSLPLLLWGSYYLCGFGDDACVWYITFVPERAYASYCEPMSLSSDDCTPVRDVCIPQLSMAPLARFSFSKQTEPGAGLPLADGCSGQLVARVRQIYRDIRCVSSQPLLTHFSSLPLMDGQCIQNGTSLLDRIILHSEHLYCSDHRPPALSVPFLRGL
ncbi:hypothetical protein EDB83DRAFT_242552 [Lactarius deliciosus]|nr:hypothetical protein EDB83DRAFT_242552 [Lactarius deliciosus]